MKPDLQVYGSPLCHWLPGESLADLSGNDLTLTQNGTSLVGSGPGGVARAAYLAGSTNYFYVDDASLRRTGDVSVEALFMLTSSPSGHTRGFACLGRETADTEDQNNLYGIDINANGNLTFTTEYAGGANNAAITGTMRILPGMWVHAVMSRSGLDVMYAINGVAEFFTEGVPPVGGEAASFIIGGAVPATGGVNGLVGYVGMVAVYDRALSADESIYLAKRRLGTRGARISVPRTLDLTIPAGRVSSDLTGFPVQVDLSGFPEEFWQHVDPSGKDLRVRDGNGVSTPLDLVWFDYEDRKGTLFTKLDVTTATDTSFRLEYGQGFEALPPTHPKGRAGVWSDYAWVCLFGADPRNRVDGSLPSATGTFESLFVESTSPNTSSHQGVAWDGTHYYVTDTDALRKFDKDFNLVTLVEDLSANVGDPVNHAGDPCIYKDFVYIPMEFWSPESWSDPHIAVFRTSDLSFVAAYPLGEEHEAAACCIGPDGLLYVASYESGTHLWVYDPDTLEPVGELELSSTISHIQGITYWQGFFWVTSDATDYIYRVTPDGTVVDAAWPTPSSEATEGIAAQHGALAYLHDPNSSHSGVVRRLVPRHPQHGVGGGGLRVTSDSYYQFSAPSFTTYTLGVSWAIADTTQRVQLSYLEGTDGQRFSIAVDDGNKAGMWDTHNLWLYASPNVDPVRNRIYRQHAVYDGTTARHMYLDGALVNTDNAISSIVGPDTILVARSSDTGVEYWRGFLGFAYLRGEALGAAWLAAEALNSRDPTFFVRRGIPDIGVDGSPLAHWIFGANYLVDLGEGEYDLTVSTGSFSESSESFDGTNTTRTVNAPARLLQEDAAFRSNGLGALTVECVIKISRSLTGQSHIAMLVGDVGAPEQEADNILWSLRYDAATNGLSYLAEYSSGINTEFNTGVLLPYERWLHVVMTRSSDGTTVRFYVNGRPVAEKTDLTAPTGGANANLMLFAQPNTFDPYQGAAAMLAIYTEELDASEVEAKARLRFGDT